MNTTLPHQPSLFAFLSSQFPLLANLGETAENYVHSDPIVCLIKLRTFGEKLTELLFTKHGLATLQENTFHTRLKELKYQLILPLQVADLLFDIKNKGNKAAHDNVGTDRDAQESLYAAFRVAKWFVEVYSDHPIDTSSLQFTLPVRTDWREVLVQLESNYKELEAKYQQLQAAKAIPTLSAEQASEIKTKAVLAVEKLDLTEAETRKLIDQQLRQAGWEADTETLRFSKGTRPQKGRNLAIAEWPVGGREADYALFIDLELYGIVEAKKKQKDVVSDLSQAKDYSKKAEKKHGAKLLKGPWNAFQVPFMFTSNSRPYLAQLPNKSGVWFLDGRKATNHPRALQGWYSPEGLKKYYTQDVDQAGARLEAESSDYLKDPDGLGLRDYQLEAIDAVEKKVIEISEERRALLAMATGTGKTRTIIGLCYRLIKAQRFRRILFLVDRSILGQQAADSFGDVRIEDFQTFADIYDLKGMGDKQPDLDTKLHFATVQGMVKRLFNPEEGQPILSVDSYDCIIVDEAHRGYTLDKSLSEDEMAFKSQRDFQSQYKRVLEYFDAFRVGLTATPALHTTEIFGKPVYRYTYRQAVLDGFLIDHEPPFHIQTKLNQEGIKWEKGAKPKAYDRETNSIVELDELEDELQFDVENFNKMVLTESFNRTVAKELVNHLDPESKKKTLVFAATDDHADEVVRILKEEFAHVGLEVDDEAICKITGSVDKPHEAVKRFKNERFPNIVVTVDLLTTGVDVPEICNLVFLRRVRSRILYEQMLGRATRLAHHIGKETFCIFDAVRLYEALEEVTTMKPVVANPNIKFSQLVNELDLIPSEALLQTQIEQIIAKLQRKKRYMEGTSAEHFNYHSEGLSPDQFIQQLHNVSATEAAGIIRRRRGLFSFLDEMKGVPEVQLVSEHVDEYLSTQRGYGNGQKPEDYIESFKQFVIENQNKIFALQIVCARPKELTRQALHQLKLELDSAGFNTVKLQTAWREAKNEDIAADIIAYIRTLAVGDALISHENRIKQAIQKVKSQQKWNAIQLRWLDRIQQQLIKESVLDREAFDQEPFKADGGYRQLNKIFNNNLDGLLVSIQDQLFTQPA